MGPARHGFDLPATLRRGGSWLVVGIVIGTLALASVTLWRLAGEGRPLSAVDEYAHADTAFKVHKGRYPFRGAVLSQEVIDTWHCYTGHTVITWEAECGSPESRPKGLPAPSGKYTTGYIHYPTYFVAGEVARRGHDVTVGEAEQPIDTYRQFAAAMTAVGMAVGGLAAWRLGLRGWALAAGAFAPGAAPSILVYGTMVNPQSIALLCGALIAWSGIRWIRTGRGFWWLAAAVAFASSIAVTAALAGGVFLLACLLALVLRLRGREFDSGWTPRWWHAGVLTVILVAPILLFGAWIESRATIDDSFLYAHYQLQDWSTLWFGVWAEIWVTHLPWVDDGSLVRPELSQLRNYARAVGLGMPFLVTTLTAGGVLLSATGALRPRRGDTTPEPEGTTAAEAEATAAEAETTPRKPHSAMALLALASALGILIYPPALRLLNAINYGIDHAIVSRYSISLTPLFVLIVLIQGRDHPWVGRLLGVVATAGVVTLCITSW
jgi:hypothetical protein